MATSDTEPTWKKCIFKKLEERDYKESKPFIGIFTSYQNAIFKSTQPIRGFSEQTERLQTTQTELVQCKIELAEVYEKTAEHARSLCDYIEKSKQIESRLHICTIQLDNANNEKETLINRIQKTESDYKAKEMAFKTLTNEYRALESAYRDIEQHISSQRKVVYDVKEKSSLEEQKINKMEEQIFTSVKVINDLNEEIALLKQKLRKSYNKSQSDNIETSNKDNTTNQRRLTLPLGISNFFDSKPAVNVNLDKPVSLLDGFGTIGSFDTPPIAKNRTINAHSESVLQICYNPQGNLLATCSNDKTVKTWTTLGASNCRTFRGSTRAVRSIVFSLDGRSIIGGSSDNAIYQWEQKSGKLLQKLLGHRDKVTAVKFLDSTTLFSASHDRKFQQWDIQKGSTISSVNSGSRINDICTTSFHSLITANFDQSIRLYDIRNMELIEQIQCHNDIVTSVSCSSDFSSILTSSRDGSLQLIDCRKMEPIREYRCSEYSNRTDVNRACYSGTEKYVMAGSSSGKIIIWNKDTGEIYDKTARISKSITTLGISFTGFQMASGIQDGTVVLWDQ